MFIKRIIPCLDVKNGEVVKGINFENLKSVGDPPDLAKRYESQGADEITFLDITASVESRKTMLDVVKRTADRLSIPLTVGGGIRTVNDVRNTLNAGANKVSINSAAVENPSMISDCAENFGKQYVVIAIDAKKKGNSWEVYTHGGTKGTGIDAEEWAQKVEDFGAGEILLTSMDADGVKAGYDIPLTAAIADAVKIPVIASGGCGSVEHIYELFTQTSAAAALIASMFHYRESTVSQVKQYLKDKGVEVKWPI